MVSLKLYGLFSCVLFGYVSGASTQCPAIVTRTQWGANPAKEVTKIKKPNVSLVVVHHTDTLRCTSMEQCKNRVKNIQDYHQDVKKWSDIGYNFLIGAEGSIFEGRGWGVVGAHARNYNSRSVGISLIGSYQNTRPSEAQLEALRALIDCGVKQNHISASYHLNGHRQVANTLCPGDELYNILKTMPHFSADHA